MNKDGAKHRINKFSNFSSNKKKKIIIIAIIAIIAISVIGLGFNDYISNSNLSISNNTATNNNREGNTVVPNIDNSIASNSIDTVGNETKISAQDKRFFCGNQTQGPSPFVNEFGFPIPCAQPLGLAVDKNNDIWIASGKTGNLFVFDSKSNTFNKTIPIPNWPIDKQGQIGTMIWDLKFDKNGDLWFTDQRSNSIWKYFTQEGRFENYKLLQDGGYPLSVAFDSSGKVWFTQVFGKRLGLIDPSLVESNTTKGVSELDFLNQIQFVTMGPLSNGFIHNNSLQNNNSNNQSETLWFSTVSYPIGGQLIKYDIGQQQLSIHDLTYLHSVPIGISEDENGNVWVNDHDSSIFMMLDPDTGDIKQFATSNSSTASKSTLPYYNEYINGKLWLNEHYGNSIAYYDKENKTLVEFIVPSINPLWGNGSNPLRFTVDNNGSVWFTEWTENKLGVIPKEKIEQLPISVSTSKDKIIIDSVNNIGDSVEVYVKKNDNSSNSLNNPSENNTEFDKPANITMYATSSKSRDGELSNLTSNFSIKSFTMNNSASNVEPNTENSTQTFKTTLEISPDKGLESGNHTLTISARYNNDLTVSKIIDMEIR
ncbi:MAG: hypothetical protein R2685_02665 [Candidatus Nitrosocosmicus sp.]|nr:hypothetical protein [Candidatus Nitrosocosmicus sp.]